MNRIQALLSNPHTTWAGVLAFTLQVAQIWAPTEYDQRLDKTTALVLAYAAVMGGDARPKGGPTVSDPEAGPTKTQ